MLVLGIRVIKKFYFVWKHSMMVVMRCMVLLGKFSLVWYSCKCNLS